VTTRGQLLDTLADLQRMARQAPPEIGHHLTLAARAVENALDNMHGQGQEWKRHAQVMPRYRSNPQLVIFNPPMRARRVMRTGRVAGMISENVHKLFYTHVEDGKAYVHEFETPVQMIALDAGQMGRESGRDILLTSPDGLPLWEDF
jgi:hypothetical protein